MSETWFNWNVVNQIEAIVYIFNLLLIFLFLSLFGGRPTPFGILFFILFADFIFYKFRHPKYIDSNRKK